MYSVSRKIKKFQCRRQVCKPLYWYGIRNFSIFRTEAFLWVWIQLGNLGPNLQDVKYISSSWKGGTQLKLNSKARELLDKSRYHNLERFKKWGSDMVPCRKVQDTSKHSSLHRLPMLLGTVPFRILFERSRYFNDRNNAKLGNDPISWLFDNLKSSNESFVHLDKLLISSTSCALGLLYKKYNLCKVHISLIYFGRLTSLLVSKFKLSREVRDFQ